MDRLGWAAVVSALTVSVAGCGRKAADVPLAARSEPAQPPIEARYAGRQACARCHARETERWSGSHHDLAMQPADASTVLGDFGGKSFAYHGVTSTFFKRGGKFLTRTDGPDGKLHEYEIAYTFGVHPLQQYLIAFPGGRYQALNVCWDTRPAKEGGQRWFHLYPDENVTHEHPFHWTGPYQNWNFMCAECHSTNVKKGYDPGQDRYETKFAELDVSCEACHGPGSEHVAWGAAREQGTAAGEDPRKGLVAALKDPAGPSTWLFEPQRGVAFRSVPRTSHAEVETCARCHARRSVVSEDYLPGRPLLDTHRPALLDEALYFADGQIQDEVYEYASFLQSRMYRAGVTCSDCHDPHSLKVGAAPDDVCARCHLPATFDTPRHHFHKAGSKGASCVACHMATRNYMVVHARHDHSFRVPRPDLANALAAPDACSRCHADKAVQWSADAAARWWPGLAGRPSYGPALSAGRTAGVGAGPLLGALVEDAQQPAIARATALTLLERYPGAMPSGLLERNLRDGDPLVRLAAVGVAAGAEPRARFGLLQPLVADPVRSVRIDAARALVGVPVDLFLRDQRPPYERALAEYVQTQALNGDRAEGHMNLAGLHLEQGRLDEAERELLVALRLNRWFSPVYVNLADLYRQKGREAEAERVLRQGVAIDPRDPGLQHTLGLALVRQKRLKEALPLLRRASELPPQGPHYAYVYGVALDSAGQGDRALEVLRTAHQRHPSDRELLLALASLSRDRGDLVAAAGYARKLLDLAPLDADALGLLAEADPAARR